MKCLFTITLLISCLFCFSQTNNEIELINAARTGDLPLVKTLVSSGTNINATDSDGSNALIISLANTQNQVAKWLVKNGADINKPNNDRLTPLYFASYILDDDMVQFLISNGASENSLSKFLVVWRKVNGAYHGDDVSGLTLQEVMTGLIELDQAIANPIQKRALHAFFHGYVDAYHTHALTSLDLTEEKNRRLPIIQILYVYEEVIDDVIAQNQSGRAEIVDAYTAFVRFIHKSLQLRSLAQMVPDQAITNVLARELAEFNTGFSNYFSFDYPLVFTRLDALYLEATRRGRRSYYLKERSNLELINDFKIRQVTMAQLLKEEQITDSEACQGISMLYGVLNAVNLDINDTEGIQNIDYTPGEDRLADFDFSNFSFSYTDVQSIDFSSLIPKGNLKAIEEIVGSVDKSTSREFKNDLFDNLLKPFSANPNAKEYFDNCRKFYALKHMASLDLNQDGQLSAVNELFVRLSSKSLYDNLTTLLKQYYAAINKTIMIDQLRSDEYQALPQSFGGSADYNTYQVIKIPGIFERPGIYKSDFDCIIDMQGEDLNMHPLAVLITSPIVRQQPDLLVPSMTYGRMTSVYVKAKSIKNLFIISSGDNSIHRYRVPGKSKDATFNGADAIFTSYKEAYHVRDGKKLVWKDGRPQYVTNWKTKYRTKWKKVKDAQPGQKDGLRGFEGIHGGFLILEAKDRLEYSEQISFVGIGGSGGTGGNAGIGGKMNRTNAKRHRSAKAGYGGQGGNSGAVRVIGLPDASPNRLAKISPILLNGKGGKPGQGVESNDRFGIKGRMLGVDIFYGISGEIRNPY